MPNSAWGEEQPVIQEKSESKALYWSLGATLIPVAVAIIGDTMVTVVDRIQNTSESDSICVGFSMVIGWPVGIVIGPSAGHWYAGNDSRGFNSFLLRTGLSVLSVSAFMAGAFVKFGGNDVPANTFFGASAVFAGGALTSAVYDIVTAPKSARLYNEKRKNQQSFFVQPIASKNKYHLLAGYVF